MTDKWSPAVELKILADCVFWVRLEDGSQYVVNMEPHLETRKNLFEDLKDPEIFKQVRIEEHFGALEWPNGLDMCVDWIREHGRRVDSHGSDA